MSGQLVVASSAFRVTLCFGLRSKLANGNRITLADLDGNPATYFATPALVASPLHCAAIMADSQANSTRGLMPMSSAMLLTMTPRFRAVGLPLRLSIR